MSLARCSLVCLLAMLGPSVLSAAEQDNWPRFRGPNGAGIGHARGLPATWTDKDYLWQAELPGIGHSSPVVFGERLFVTSADADQGQRYLLCFQADDGKLLWTRTFPFSSYKKHARNSYASSTPAVDADHVYLPWYSPDGSTLLALDHQGNDVWSHPLPPFEAGHGGAASPIVYQDLVVIGNDQERQAFLLAVDRRTGQTRWQVPRHPCKASYSTPCVFRSPAGADELIFTNWYHGITSIDPASGRLNWEIDVFERDEEKRSIGSPIVAGDLVIGSSAFVAGRKYLVAVRPTVGGDVQEVYRMDRAVAHMPTTLVHEGLLFVWDDKGIVSCLQADSGRIVWQKRVGGNYSGSPVCVEGRLYCLSEEGEALVLAAAEQFAELGRVDLGEPSSSTPAVAGGRIFLRTHSRLYTLAPSR